MSEPVNAILNYLPPERRRRIGNALMTQQYDRATPEEGAVAQRHGLLPLATYDNGRTGLAFPGIVAEPVESFNRLLQNGYTSGDARDVEDAFNVAGGAMLGGIAAPRPRGSLGTLSMEILDKMQKPSGGTGFVAPTSPPLLKTEPLIGYRGSASSGGTFKDRGYVFASSDPANASQYALDPFIRYKGTQDSPSVMPMEFRFRNPMKVDAQGRNYDSRGFDSEELLDIAARRGHDGLVVSNYVDPPYLNGPSTPQTTIAAIQRGTVYSPLTGDLLYANGGPTGPALNAILQAYGYGQPEKPRPASTKYLPGDA